MDGLFEKFSLYDFFNLIVSGALFIFGIQLLGFTPLTFINEKMNFQNEKIFIYCFWLIVCYVIGSVVQGIELFLERKGISSFQRKKIQSCLNNDSDTISNKEKRRVYQRDARRLFANKNIKVAKNQFTSDQCEYYFAYCSYCIQLKEQNKKTEKMRGIKGISSLFSICFMLLCLLGILRIIYLLGNEEPIEELFFIITCTIIFGVLGMICYYRMKVVIVNWIRMVFGTYEAGLEERYRR